jgi:endonuclease/exonuclease/phosphatase family metal-dependent hydrolase
MSQLLKIQSYNILDVELESNFVPRNMHSSCKEAIFAAAGIIDTKQKEDYWNTKFAKPYLPFHKGYGNKNKSETRQLWGNPVANTDTVGDQTYKNLMQILNEEFSDKAIQLYNMINAINYTWTENRLIRVYDKIIEAGADVVCLQEYGNGKDLQQVGGTTFTTTGNTDADTDAEARVRYNSFAQKLMYAGYDYKLYSYNPDKGNGDDGLAIFYKREVFDEKVEKKYVDMDAENQTKYTDYTTQRGCALLELTLKSGGQKVFIYTTHIQTSSNEKNKTDKYAIRRGELDYIKEHMNAANYREEDIVVFCGDFNLDLNTPADKAVIDGFELNNILKRIKLRPNEDDFGLVTSYPTGRKEYIDYFFSNRQGTLSGNYKLLSDLNGETIPNNTDEPSDHISILFTIPFTSGGKTRKRRKPKKPKSKKTKSKKPKSKKPKSNKRKYH